MAPFFSVVTPTYRQPRMVAAAILSLLEQTERDFEAFVIDDCSGDDTQRILAALPKDPRVSYIKMEKNRGQHVCRNEAIRRASGKFVTFLDHDDLYLPERLAEFRKAIEARPSAGFWFSNAYVWRFDAVVGSLFDPEREIPEGKVPGHYAMGGNYLPYLTTNVAIRREEFERHGYFAEDLGFLEDTQLYMKMLTGGVEVGAIRKPVAVSRIHDQQRTHDHALGFKEAALALAASNLEPEVLARRRRELAADVASNMIKALQPAKARELLDAEFKDGERPSPLYAATFIPVPLLSAMKTVRRLYLGARYGAFAPAEHREVERLVRLHLERAERL